MQYLFNVLKYFWPYFSRLYTRCVPLTVNRLFMMIRIIVLGSHNSFSFMECTRTNWKWCMTGCREQSIASKKKQKIYSVLLQSMHRDLNCFCPFATCAANGVRHWAYIKIWYICIKFDCIGTELRRWLICIFANCHDDEFDRSAWLVAIFVGWKMCWSFTTQNNWLYDGVWTQSDGKMYSSDKYLNITSVLLGVGEAK